LISKGVAGDVGQRWILKFNITAANAAIDIEGQPFTTNITAANAAIPMSRHQRRNTYKCMVCIQVQRTGNICSIKGM